MEFEKIRRLLSCVRRAADDYDMIEEGDRIAVGLSGGKDSTALLCALAELRRFYPKSFSLVAITVDMGLPGMDFTPLRALCEGLGIPYEIVKTDLAAIIFEHRKESNPCALCAKMRRGILHDNAKRLGCNKIALGHHYDDAVVTFLMNLMNEGRIGCFSPVTYLSRKDITMIRPLLYARESDVRYFVKANAIPVVKSTCPEDKHTDREKYATLLTTLEKENRGLRHRLFHAMQKAGVDGFKEVPSERRRKGSFDEGEKENEG